MPSCALLTVLEHPAERHAIDDSALDTESDDSAGVLVHNHQYPIRLQADRFTAKQVEAPQTVLHMADECQPGWSVFRRRRPVMDGENPPNHILINRCCESQIDLLGDLRTSPARIAPLHRRRPGSDPLWDPSDLASF